MEDVCHNKIPRNVSKHKYVIDYYNGLHGGKTNHRRSQIAENLKRMKAERVTSDYDNNSQNLKTMHKLAQFVLELSEDVIVLTETGGL